MNESTSWKQVLELYLQVVLGGVCLYGIEIMVYLNPSINVSKLAHGVSRTEAQSTQRVSAKTLLLQRIELLQ